jgi:glycerol-3-phosphate acyltransferase PlsY
MIQERIISLLIGYLFGNLLFGFFYGKLRNTDIRKQGSGNIGSTNTLRILGVLPGFLSLFCDCMKVVVGALVVGLIFKGYAPADISLFKMYAAAGTILGHDFPAILKFKGGKGIACSLGFLIVVCPVFLPAAVSVFLMAVILTRYVSLGSIMGCGVIFVQAIVFFCMGDLPFKGGYSVEALLVILFLSSLAIILHHGNIDRLIHGKENRFSFHPNTNKPKEA